MYHGISYYSFPMVHDHSSSWLDMGSVTFLSTIVPGSTSRYPLSTEEHFPDDFKSDNRISHFRRCRAMYQPQVILFVHRKELQSAIAPDWQTSEWRKRSPSALDVSPSPFEVAAKRAGKPLESCQQWDSGLMSTS